MTDGRDRMVLECRDLSVVYGDVRAVDRVTLRVSRGEIFGLLGPNGAGKTSVIRALTTIVPFSGGTASVGGHDLRDATRVRSAIGVLPESNGYPGAQTATAYLRFYGQLFGLPRQVADERARRLLRQMGLEGNERRIATYSRGMRQRLGLCRSLINEPTVLFLDEPTLGLDPAGKDEILHHLAATAVEDGTCVILCSHLLDEVERVCDRVGVMHRGSIVADGTVDEVIAASGVPPRGWLRVSAEDVAAAAAALRRSIGAAALDFDNALPGQISVRLDGHSQARGTIVRTLLEAGIEPRSFDLQGARLSEAFLALTARRAEANR